jgi:molybdate transport system substrate-binding protein
MRRFTTLLNLTRLFINRRSSSLSSGQVAGFVSATPTARAVSGELTVFAAASLTDVFSEIGQAFTDEHPQANVPSFTFGPSNGLATRIIQAEPADVFASAAQQPMDNVAAANLVQGKPRVFAHNLLEIAVKPGNPLRITTLQDLARADVTLVLAAAGVPAGDYARQALNNAGVTVTPAFLEADVRAVLARVASQADGADAGIVYVTDVIAANGTVEGVPIPQNLNVEATYPIAALTRASNPNTARAFVDFVLSPPGQKILSKFGFLKP